MNDDLGMLDAIGDGAIGRGLVSVWERLAPLSVGAVASGVAILAGGSLLRRALGSTRGRGLRWVGVAALVPLGLWLWAGADEDEPAESRPEEAPEA